MSSPKPPSHYYDRATSGDVTWLEDAIEDYLGLFVTPAQQQICRALLQNENLLVITANGLGKSYILAAITNVWLCCLYPAVAFATSGTEKKMRRTYCRPVESLHDNARIPLPGTYKKQPDRIDFEEDPEQYFEASSPKDAGELEGVHSAYTLAIIEEADKDDVDHDVIEAMESLVTDERDRIIAIANPPDDEINCVYDLMQDPEWETVQFSSFESHNVQVEVGETDGEMIDGLATLHKIKKDWRRYNTRPWPGVDEARHSYGETGLGKCWYKRRLGRIPPGNAAVHRPFDRDAIEAAFDRDDVEPMGPPLGIGVDVARKGGDKNVIALAYENQVSILDFWQGLDHNENEARIRRRLKDNWEPRLAIDSTGEGSGLADRVDNFYPNMYRFDAGRNATQETKWDDCWAEGLNMLGSFMKEGGSISNRLLREELFAAARTVEYSQKFIGSRGADGATVYTATSKEAVKDHLERSPDYLDAAYMAVWARDAEPEQNEISGTWGGTWSSF